MHILFVHTNIDISSPMFSPAIAVLSAVVKEKGHTASLLLIDDAIDRDRIITRISEEKPGLVAITSTTSQWQSVNNVANIIKKSSDVPIICGGIHPTLCPEQAIAMPWFDAVCLGEGEGALVEYIEALEGRRSVESIENLWVRVKRRLLKDKVFRNNLRPAIKNLDELPLWDIEIFGPENFSRKNTYSFMGNPGFFPFTTGRGCPYSCTYCCNISLKAIYSEGLGPFMRKHSLDYIVYGLRTLCDRYDVRGFEFFDEMLSLSDKWIESFCNRYASDIGLPYLTTLRPEHATEKNLKKLRDSGCFMIGMGIECGNEEYRRKYLNRKMTNEQIVKAFRYAKELGIKTLAWNMIGLPFETADMIRETIVLNRKVRPDIVGVAVFEPLPKTPLRDLCEEEGLLNDRRVLIYSDQSVLNQKTITQEELSQCFHEFQKLAGEFHTEKVEWR